MSGRVVVTMTAEQVAQLYDLDPHALRELQAALAPVVPHNEIEESVLESVNA